MSARVREHLVRMWRGLLPTYATHFAIIEDPARPHPENIEAFGLGVFVSDGFVDEFHADPQPYVAAIIYERMLAGRSPVLTLPQIRQANSSGGLNFVVLHFGLRNHDLSNERTERAIQVGSAAFYFCHSGFRLKSLLNEVYGPQQAGYMEAGGFRIANDFANCAASLGVMAPEHRPLLFVCRKEWVVPGALNQLGFLFRVPEPQLGFSLSEQRVLLRALVNESDVQIAKDLGVSLDAVKKTWRRVFEREARTAPYLIDANDQPAAAHRGTEKRRHLIDYLRTHLEELRPRANPLIAARRRHRAPKS